MEAGKRPVGRGEIVRMLRPGAARSEGDRVAAVAGMWEVSRRLGKLLMVMDRHLCSSTPCAGRP